MKKHKHYWVTSPTVIGGVYVIDDRITHTSRFAAHCVGWSLDAFLVYCKAKKWAVGSQFQFRDPAQEWRSARCPSCLGDNYAYEDELPEEAFILPDRLARKWGFLCR